MRLIGVPAQIAIAKGLARLIRAIHVPPAKCLAVDLDDTLWGGILGEVGRGGIALGQDYPGRVYRDFQSALRALRQRGILLAIASKNNEVEVREVFAHHLDMVLRWEDFAATQIHWGDKAGSLRAIAEQLRIGLDALAFYDDSPVEREWVRSELPEVNVIEVPTSVAWMKVFPAFDLWSRGRITETATLLDHMVRDLRGDDEVAAAVGLMQVTLGRLRAAETAFHAMSSLSERQELLAYTALARDDIAGARAALRSDPKLLDPATWIFIGSKHQ